MKTNAKTTSLTVTGLGALTTLLGRKVFRGMLGAGVTGFGLAHVALGMLDMARPSVRKRA